MEDIGTIIDELNLLYYEYDKHTHKLIVDKDCTPSEVYQEFIRVTYTLSKYNIEFMIDENRDILLSMEDKFFARIAQRIKNILFGIKNSQKNIYLLSDKKVKHAQNFPQIDIKVIEQEVDLSQYDGLIFTSKNGIKSIDKITSTWKEIPAYVIAPQTAKTLKWHGGKLEYVGKDKHGDQFAKELIPKLQNKKVLYISGAKTVSNLVDILNENGVLCEQKVIYETFCKEYPKKIKLPKNSIIIFSSPSTIECFLKNTHWDESFTAISIGQTTAQHFPEYITPIVSENTSLDGCVQKALQLD